MNVAVEEIVLTFIVNKRQTSDTGNEMFFLQEFHNLHHVLGLNPKLFIWNSFFRL